MKWKNGRLNLDPETGSLRGNGEKRKKQRKQNGAINEKKTSLKKKDAVVVLPEKKPIKTTVSPQKTSVISVKKKSSVVVHLKEEHNFKKTFVPPPPANKCDAFINGIINDILTNKNILRPTISTDSAAMTSLPMNTTIDFASLFAKAPLLPSMHKISSLSNTSTPPILANQSVHQYLPPIKYYQ